MKRSSCRSYYFRRAAAAAEEGARVALAARPFAAVALCLDDADGSLALFHADANRELRLVDACAKATEGLLPVCVQYVAGTKTGLSVATLLCRLPKSTSLRVLELLR